MPSKEKLIEFAVNYGPQVVGAVIILAIGFIAARWLGSLFDKWLSKRHLEPPIRILLVRVIRLLVFTFAAVMALAKFGVDIVPIVAGMGVIGVGIGLAAQGVLSNLVAGLTIIFTKPFHIGEYVELLSVYGQVVEIELFSTTLLHADQSRVVIPNRKIVGEILHNYGKIRQLDLSVNVAYHTDLQTALAAAAQVLDTNPRVLKTPAAVVGIASLGASGITLAVKPWVQVPDFAPAQAEVYQALLTRFRQLNIEIPFPHHDVRLITPPAPHAA